MPIQNTTTDRICIIIVYFGPWPSWFSAWLRTCRENPSYHWLIFTDNQQPAETPDNVRIVQLMQRQLEERVSAMLQVPFVLSRGYKLVDLKPTYGELFALEIRDYDFWGYTDLDLVYGNLSGFFTAERLNSYDVLSPSDRLLVGHLTLIRNTPQLCRLYRECPDYVEILLRDTHEGFDKRISSTRHTAGSAATPEAVSERHETGRHPAPAQRAWQISDCLVSRSTVRRCRLPPNLPLSFYGKQVEPQLPRRTDSCAGDYSLHHPQGNPGMYHCIEFGACMEPGVHLPDCRTALPFQKPAPRKQETPSNGISIR